MKERERQIERIRENQRERERKENGRTTGLTF